MKLKQKSVVLMLNVDQGVDLYCLLLFSGCNSDVVYELKLFTSSIEAKVSTE